MNGQVGRLETIGYTERGTRARIAAFVACPSSYLVDIRAKPWSGWDPFWNRTELKQYYYKRYIPMPGLGNVTHHLPGHPITLQNPEPHIRDLAERLTWGGSYPLLCACKDYQRCHRKVVYDLILAELGMAVESLACEQLVQADLWSLSV